MPTSHNPLLSASRLVDPEEHADKVRRALEAAGGNVSAAARELGVDRRTLYRWLAKNPTMRPAP